MLNPNSALVGWRGERERVSYDLAPALTESPALVMDEQLHEIGNCCVPNQWTERHVETGQQA